MKGIVFCEFLEMVETAEGFDMVDRIVEESNVPGGGAYTAVGTYDHAELVSLLVAYGRIKDRGVDVILREFGQHLFRRFVVLFPRFFVDVKSSFDFLEHIESYIHVEVKKLYPDAELPRFVHRRLADGSLELIYSSLRHLPDFAEGLMIGCIDHFGERIELRREPVMFEGARAERFILSRKD
jgi:hypothetical protein